MSVNPRSRKKNGLLERHAAFPASSREGFRSPCATGTGERGSILIFTIWVLGMLSLFVLALGFQVRGTLRYLQQMEIRQKLRNIADAGTRQAVATAVISGAEDADTLGSAWSRSKGLFYEQEAGDGRFTVSYEKPDGTTDYGLIDEERKVNLNKTKSLRVLAGVFEFGAGMEPGEASDLAASIQDWRDEDDVINAGGAESRDYHTHTPAYNAKNKDLDTLEELLMIKGMTPRIYQAVLPYVTLDGAPVLNINTASAQVLRANGFSENLARSVLAYRMGRDLKEGTPDDRFFNNKESIVDALSGVVSLPDSEKQSLDSFVHSGLLDIKSRTFTARVTARLDHRSEALTRTCVFDRPDGTIKRCQEYFHRIEELPPGKD